MTLTLLIATSCSEQPRGDLDLEATSFSYSPTNVYVGTKVRFRHSVKNLGTNTIPAQTYQVDIFVDGQLSDFDHATSELRPGQRVDYLMERNGVSWQPTNAGRHHYRYIVAGIGDFPERTKTNNVLEGDIDVLL